MIKVATNTPFSFSLRNGYEFYQLGERLNNTTMIVLMLQRNWSSASIQKIKSLTHWISAYPKEIPCYIIGCETTMSGEELPRYRNRDRDSAIKSLCDEVLKRSRSIAVRGELTKRYLVESLGYCDSQVDEIYDANADNNSFRIRNFLKKNNCPLQQHVAGILAFQEKPAKLIYERDINFNRNIIIGEPYISAVETGVRLCAEIEIDGTKTTLWCETDEEYCQYLISDRCDPFLCVVLPYAGVPPLKWSTYWDRIVPFSGGWRDGWQARKARGYRAEAATS